jgi:hypothetical protein
MECGMNNPANDEERLVLNPAICKAVEAELGERIICDRCGAIISTMEQRCLVPMGVTCPGSATFSAAIIRQAKRLRFPSPPGTA